MSVATRPDPLDFKKTFAAKAWSIEVERHGSLWEFSWGEARPGCQLHTAFTDEDLQAFGIDPDTVAERILSRRWPPGSPV